MFDDDFASFHLENAQIFNFILIFIDFFHFYLEFGIKYFKEAKG